MRVRAYAEERWEGKEMNHRVIIDQDICPLSPREKEAVYWASMGKTAMETGMLLNKSPSSINMLLQRAADKAHMNTKPGLVAMAIRKGWIE